MACSACISGTLHEGTPTGEEKELYGLKTYIASPPAGAEPKGTIVVIPDAFGWTFNNNRILADNFAAKGGFEVLLPDVMLGWQMSPDVLGIMDTLMAKHDSYGMHTLWKITAIPKVMGHFIPWLYGTRFGVTQPRVVSYMKALRDAKPDAKIGAAGYCWGGKHVFLLCADKEKSTAGKSLIDVGFAAHPSFVKFPDDVKDIKLPLSVAAPELDNQIKKEKIPDLKEFLEKSPKECEVKVYEGATHGFAIRANPHNPKENEQGVEAEEQAISWFTKMFPS